MKMTNSNNFYVYMLIDPRNDKPFYIGLSSQYKPNSKSIYRKYTRLSSHFLTRSKDWWNKYKEEKKNLSHKENIIRYCVLHDIEIPVKIVAENISEEEAKKLEMNLIEKYGREYFENGCLTNISKGGDHHNQTHEQAVRSKLKFLRDNPEKAEKIKKDSAQRLKALWRDEKFAKHSKETSSLTLKRRWKDENEREKFIKQTKDLWANKRDMLIDCIKNNWKRKEFRDVCIKNLDHSSETQSRRSKNFHKEHPGFNKEYLIKYNKSEKGRRESVRRAEHMRNLLKTKSEEEMLIINLKRSLSKGLFSKKDRFLELKPKDLSEYILSTLKKLFVLDKEYIVNLGLSKEVYNEISK